MIQKAEGEMKHLLFGNFFYQSIKSHNKKIVKFLLSQGILYENALFVHLLIETKKIYFNI